jgi:hypothetical protein
MAGSIINDDHKVARQRRNPLKDDPDQNLQVTVNKREQLLSSLDKRVKDQELHDKAVKLWETGNADRTKWLQRQELYLSDWDEHLESSAEGPFNQASTLHIPMPLIVVKTLHARFLQALIGIDPPFQAKPRNPGSVNSAKRVQDVTRYMLDEHANNRKGAFEAIDMWIWDWVTTGAGLVKVRWDAKFNRYIDVVPRQVEGPPIFDVGPDGNEISIPTVRTEYDDVIRTEKTWEGPVFERLAPEDVLIIGGGDPQDSDAVIQSTMMTASELLTLADRKIFNIEAVNKVLSSGPDSYIDNEASNIYHQRSRNAGQSDIDTPARLDRYKILECYMKADVDGSGINSDIVLWVHRSSRTLLRSTFLHRITKNGRRPIFKTDFIRRPGQEYGTGILEVIHPLSVEMDAMHNMRIDFGTLSTMPFGFYRPTSSIDPETIQLEPGALIPVDNPQTDIFFPQLGNRTAFGIQEEAALQQMVDRLTGISDLTLGVLSSQQGATRTATGTRALVGELSANLDVFVRRLNITWKQVLEYLVDMLQEKLPSNFDYRIFGDSSARYWDRINSREEIRGDFDIEISPNSSSSNQQLLEQRAMELLQLTSNPIDLQLGIITAQERYEAIKNFLKVRGIKDFSQYVREPADLEPWITPEEEANKVLRGDPVEVTPNMDHQGFINYVEMIKKDDLIFGQYDENQAVMLEQQSRKHAQMVKALQQMQAQQQNIAQMQQNMNLGTQSPQGGLGIPGGGQ